MKHEDFKVGGTFFSACGDKKWLCTDKGQRVVIAIEVDEEHDPSWLNGPPYALAEHVFDEYDVMGCSKEPE